MRKYLLILSLAANFLFAAHFAWKRAANYYARTRDTSKDSMVTFTYNKYKVLAQREAYYRFFPIRSTDIVFVGNSLVESFPVTPMFNSLKVQNRGIAGTNTGELLARIDSIAAPRPEKIFIMDGINDIGQRVSREKTMRNFEEIIRHIQKLSPRTRIYVHSILPDNNPGTVAVIKGYNDQLRTICARYQATYIDIFPLFLDGTQIKKKLTLDGVHLTLDGYVVWRNAVLKYVNE
ncbi:GDSL-type esterase/lipase family protein [Hufsiella ginkgonis]|uniref:SGNH hydrolase-type esterase domain-containing protein n=1 Tax=Hufsiella ginkgonis TaxID=2695274 RepID=A0A7K1Y2Y4_9SPHI|nr:GDSL-type esterase/lipase family protein [Hufsiella ginkgonis]MXV17458.1 hypothetical protein [Hufsiella ginkgonis]